ncbi:MAG: head GIN domain-containing protein [Flavobacteriaceae bacterium]|nr:head GIN domain-containing protein [Flavobacteriaceae bacterium]
MKKVLLSLISFFLLACNGDKVPDCFQNSGDIISKEISVKEFSRITVFERIELILIDGPEYKVVLETGEYLENDISAKVVGDRLVLRNENACNLTRDYGITKFYVTAPNIVEVRNSSGLTVGNQGTLTYPDLTLISEDFEEEDLYHTDGHFRLKVNSERLTVILNNISHTFLEGSVDQLTINTFSGDARFECADLIATNVQINHRGTNDIIVYPVESVRGQLRSTGDLILVNTPPIIEVDEIYTGRVIIRD